MIKGHNYINVSVAVVNTEGAAIDATSTEAWFYKISQVDGSLSLDTGIDGDGKVTLSKQDGVTGFYGAPVNVSAVGTVEYVVLIKVLVGFTETITVDTVSIASATSVDYSAIADAVWDEILSGTMHFAPGTTGEALLLVKGLVQHNFVMDQTIYNTKGLMQSARLRVFSNKTEVLTATDGGLCEGEIGIFNVTVESEMCPDDDRVKTYRVVREV